MLVSVTKHSPWSTPPADREHLLQRPLLTGPNPPPEGNDEFERPPLLQPCRLSRPRGSQLTPVCDVLPSGQPATVARRFKQRGQQSQADVFGPDGQRGRSTTDRRGFVPSIPVLISSNCLFVAT